MAVGFFDWQLYGPLFSDPKMAAIFAEDAAIAAWLRVEQALSKTQASLDMVPSAVALAIAGLGPDQIDKAKLARDTEEIGRPIVGLVRQIQALVPKDLRRWVHFGGTTQDIMDTALMLQTSEALDRIEQQLFELDRALDHLSRKGIGMMLAGRTNGQHAQPVPFSHKIDLLAGEIRRHIDRLPPIRERLLQVQLGGAVGTLSAFGERGEALRQALGAELGLGAQDRTWQSTRDTIGEAAAWLSLIAASVEKIGWTFGHLASSDLGEIRLGGSKGQSSAMPHKNNPRNAEFAEALARLARQRAVSVIETGRHEHERSGGAWIAEWMLVPETFLLTSASLGQAAKLVEQAEPDHERMGLNLANSYDTLASEVLVTALSDHVGRDLAHDIVAAACDRALIEKRAVLDILMAEPRLAGWVERDRLSAVIDAVYGRPSC